MPLLASADAAVELEPGGRMAAALIERWPPETRRHGSRPRPTPRRRPQARAERLAPHRGLPARRPDGPITAPRPVALPGVDGDAPVPAPVVRAFDGWRDEERWLRRYCPTCGSLPAMAQLVGAEPGRKRLLSCGGCGTRWQYKRTGCPFCDTDSQRLASVAIEGGRARPAHRPLRVVPRLPQDLQRPGRRGPVARGLVFAPSGSGRPRSRTGTAGRLALRLRAFERRFLNSGGSGARI